MAAPRILVVEDDRLSREIYGDWLRSFGYSVVVAESAEVAAVLLAKEQMDLVLTDLILPGRDGLSLLAEARRLNPEADVVVVTALDQVAPAVRALKAGAADYLLKPLAKDALELTVSRCLTSRQLMRENQALRDQMGLFERGRRVTATLEPTELWPLSLSTLLEAVSARSGVLVALDPAGSASALAEIQLEANGAAELVDRLRSQLRTALTEQAPRWLESVAGWSTPVVVVPCPDRGEVRCAGVLTLERMPGEASRAAVDGRVRYLARNIGLAHANAARFAEAETLALTDDLTGLRNDRALRAEIDRLLEAAPDRPFAVLFLDLDYFKVINDAHGHLLGSRVLAEVGKVLRGCVRDIDVPARYGGDEFAIVLPGSDSGEALKVAERVRRSLQDHPFADGVQLTACIGIACHPEHGGDRQSLLARADAAMYRGKQGRRNVVYLATDH